MTEGPVSRPSSSSSSTLPDSQNQRQPKEKPGQWGLILRTGKQKPHDVRMRDDTGTDVNWIHPYLVERCKLEKETCETQFIKDMGGKVHGIKEFVWFTWAGRGNLTYSGKFYITPQKSDVDVLLGKVFVDEYGRAEKVCSPDRQIPVAGVFTQSSPKPGEADATKASQADQAKLAAAAEQKRKDKKDKKAKEKSSGSGGHKK